MAAATKEVWMPVKGFEGCYEVSTLGRVRSLDRKIRYRWGKRIIKGQILLPIEHKNGYLVVGLGLNGRHYIRSIHRLVAEAFIPNPQGKPEVGHEDHDKANNVVSNLSWVTRGENEKHSYRTGHRISTKSKLQEGDIPVILRRLRLGESCRSIAKDFGVHNSNISRVGRGLNQIRFRKVV